MYYFSSSPKDEHDIGLKSETSKRVLNDTYLDVTDEEFFYIVNLNLTIF